MGGPFLLSAIAARACPHNLHDPAWKGKTPLGDEAQTGHTIFSTLGSLGKCEKLGQKLLKFCSLEWDDKCLNHQKNKRVIKTISYNQARKPIYNSSVKSFKGYDDYLSVLKKLN